MTNEAGEFEYETDNCPQHGVQNVDDVREAARMYGGYFVKLGCGCQYHRSDNDILQRMFENMEANGDAS